MMDLSKYRLEALRQDGEFILYCGFAPDPYGGESTIYSRIVAADGGSRSNHHSLV